MIDVEFEQLFPKPPTIGTKQCFILDLSSYNTTENSELTIELEFEAPGCPAGLLLHVTAVIEATLRKRTNDPYWASNKSLFS